MKNLTTTIGQLLMAIFPAIVIAVLIFAMANNTYAQRLSYEVVIETNGTKEEVFESAQEWLVSMFNDKKHLIKIQDADSGLLTAKGYEKINYHDEYSVINGEMSYEIEINIKPGQFTVKLYNFRHKANNGNSFHSIKDTGSTPLKYYSKKKTQKYWERIQWLAEYTSQRNINWIKSKI